MWSILFATFATCTVSASLPWFILLYTALALLVIDSHSCYWSILQIKATQARHFPNKWSLVPYLCSSLILCVTVISLKMCYRRLESVGACFGHSLCPYWWFCHAHAPHFIISMSLWPGEVLVLSRSSPVMILHNFYNISVTDTRRRCQWRKRWRTMSINNMARGKFVAVQQLELDLIDYLPYVSVDVMVW